MNQYDNTNRGRLFKNDRKEKETHPDFRGDCELSVKELKALLAEATGETVPFYVKAVSYTHLTLPTNREV